MRYISIKSIMMQNPFLKTESRLRAQYINHSIKKLMNNSRLESSPVLSSERLRLTGNILL